MHTSVEPSEMKSLMKALKGNPELKPLHIRATSIARRKTGTYDAAQTGVRIRCVGKDRPALLARLSSALATRGLSIENISTDVTRGKDDRRDFNVSADCVVTSYLDQEQIQAMVDELTKLKEELDLDVMDIRVQRLVRDRP